MPLLINAAKSNLTNEQLGALTRQLLLTYRNNASTNANSGETYDESHSESYSKSHLKSHSESHLKSNYYSYPIEYVYLDIRCKPKYIKLGALKQKIWESDIGITFPTDLMSILENDDGTIGAHFDHMITYGENRPAKYYRFTQRFCDMHGGRQSLEQRLNSL